MVKYASNKELKTQTVKIKRVVKVVEGGRIFKSLSLAVAGEKGEVGFGIGKNKEVSVAIAKAENNAKKNTIKFPVTKSGTIYHEVYGRYNGCIVHFRPAPSGTGTKVGGTARKIFETCGIKNICGKVINGKSEQNVIHATFDALRKLRDPISIAQKRGISLEKLFNG